MGLRRIGSAELEFWFGMFLVPGRMGAAGLKLQLSTCEAWLRLQTCWAGVRWRVHAVKLVFL